MRLNLVGACAYAHPEYFDINPSTPPSTPLFGLTVKYKYPSAFITKATGWYNLFHIYEYVKNVEESGFLWWKDVETTEWEHEQGSGTMTIDIEDNGNYSAEQRQAMRTMIRMELVQGVMQQFGRAYYDQSQPTAAPRPESGLGVFAAGVQDTCGWFSIVCNGVHWVLLGLDAIMPGPDSHQRFERS